MSPEVFGWVADRVLIGWPDDQKLTWKFSEYFLLLMLRVSFKFLLLIVLSSFGKFSSPRNFIFIAWQFREIAKGGKCRRFQSLEHTPSALRCHTLVWLSVFCYCNYCPIWFCNTVHLLAISRFHWLPTSNKRNNTMLSSENLKPPLPFSEVYLFHQS